MSENLSTQPLVQLDTHPTDREICFITLNRPERRNAFNNQMAEALLSAVRTFESEPGCRVAILRGNGPVFCSGMDLAAFDAGERPGLESANGFAHFVRLPRRKPIIAAVQGGAHAGGLEIMLACDLAVATSGAQFSLPEVKRGIIAAGGGAVRLSSRIPQVVAREMLLTGNPINAERANTLGLINAVVEPDELESTALKLAREIIKNAPLAVEGSKAVSDRANSSGEQVAWHLNNRVWEEVVGSDDAAEGIAAFKERRPPLWAGR